MNREEIINQIKNYIENGERPDRSIELAIRQTLDDIKQMFDKVKSQRQQINNTISIARRCEKYGLDTNEVFGEYESMANTTSADASREECLEMCNTVLELFVDKNIGAINAYDYLYNGETLERESEYEYDEDDFYENGRGCSNVNSESRLESIIGY